MPTHLTRALLYTLALTTTACSSSMKTPDIKLNPHPTQRYEMTVTVHDAPGPFDKTNAGAHFEIRNVDCVPHDPFTGGADVPSANRGFQLARIDDHTWKGYFFRDLLLDEDYFGLGVCHWGVMSVGPGFHVHGLHFNTSPDLWDGPAEQSITSFFSKQQFLDQTLDGSALAWRAFDENVVQHRDAYFPITVAVKKAMP